MRQSTILRRQSKNNVVFSGLDLKATTFAQVARVAGMAEEQGAGEQSGGEFATPRSKVLGFVNHTMNVRMETNDIVACHELPARNNETVKPIIVCLLNSTVKRDLMMGRNTLKGSRIFVNEPSRRMLGYSRRRENSGGVA